MSSYTLNMSPRLLMQIAPLVSRVTGADPGDYRDTSLTFDAREVRLPYWHSSHFGVAMSSFHRADLCRRYFWFVMADHEDDIVQLSPTVYDTLDECLSGLRGSGPAPLTPDGGAPRKPQETISGQTPTHPPIWPVRRLRTRRKP